MEKAKDNPGVYIPPPLIYVAMFLLSLLVQKFIPLSKLFFQSLTSHIIGILFIIAGLFFNVPAIRQFIKTGNTLVTIKPASSLQTSGIYGVTRNPMYLSLLLFYTGLAFLFGNWWTIMLIVILIIVVTYFIIRPEERYLQRAFGKTYLDYQQKVRRWI
jgi:protein-S-isoprenylcysteine O-methyltransferase Ste14